ncbi:uncharacterized protein LOC118182446 [Stegodyphus dumicola]|uniref:uncharacterized protein LOC118182446 n=1 Tax=Stegodyphus dumicola TaxID=202533 RepID=UPI0015AF417C|nr:uncharacterized protein LOC118182446 [Stegodyphus dumicola]
MLNEQRIQIVKELRYLGLIFDEKMTLDTSQEYEIPAPDFRTHPSFKGTGVRIQVQPTATALPSQIEIYTDGSKINENTGSAFAVLRDHIVTHHWKGQLRSQNSVFQGEAIAIAQALRYLIFYGIKKAVIKTDSLSSLRALGNPDHPSTIIQTIQQDLTKHFPHQLKLEWIKAHAGHYGNETADSLAKEAASGNADTQVNIPWPSSYLKKCLRLKAIARWQEEWDEGSTGRRTQYHIAYVDNDRIISNPQLVRFITGHGPFPQYFAKRGLNHTEFCCCGDIGSPEHYLTTCPLTSDLHIQLPSTNRQAFCKFIIKAEISDYKGCQFNGQTVCAGHGLMSDSVNSPAAINVCSVWIICKFVSTI